MLALALAEVGLYGEVSYSVARQRRPAERVRSASGRRSAPTAPASSAARCQWPQVGGHRRRARARACRPRDESLPMIHEYPCVKRAGSRRCWEAGSPASTRVVTGLLQTPAVRSMRWASRRSRIRRDGPGRIVGTGLPPGAGPASRHAHDGDGAARPTARRRATAPASDTRCGGGA